MHFGEPIKLAGASSAQYTFMIVPRSTTFQAKPSVYVVGKPTGGRFEFCYVGHTADLSTRPLNKDKAACFNRFGADHILILEEFDAAKRSQIVEDLVKAYQPSCNAP
jgi:hypothetical protein